MSLKIASGFSLPLDIAGEAVAILAKRGAGKTNTATVMVEELVRAHVQTVILDPVGAWWGVRSNASGDGPGLEIPILGGPHGDVPLQEKAGELIADVAVQSGRSLLIDLSDLPTKAAMGRFVTDFAQRLYRSKGRDDSLLHLVLEEADSFAPQKVRGSEHMQSAIEQLVRRGRARGIGVTLITQRSAVLSKDVLTQADVLIVMRTTGPHDRRAVSEWIETRGDERGREVLDSLPSLETGEAWIWNPERDILHRVKVRARETFDSSRTPKAGERRAEPQKTAEIDLEALGEQIMATAERVKADDPKELRKRIAQLERELSFRPTEIETITETVTERIEVPVFRDGEVSDLISFGMSMKEAAGGIMDALSRFPSAADVAEGLKKIAPSPAVVRDAAASAARTRETGSGMRTPSVSPSLNGEVTRPQQKVLNALRWLESIGLEGERTRVAFLSGYTESGNFNNLLGKLRGAGFIDYPTPRYVALTGEGRALAEEPDETPTTAHLHAKVMEKLKGPQQKVLSVLLDAYPAPMERAELAAATEYQESGNFNNILGKLRSLGLIDYPSPRYVAAESILFLE